MTACQSVPDQPRLQITEAPKTVIVQVPVDGKPCISRADLPIAPVPTRVDVKTASTAQLAAAVSIDQRNQDEYVQKLQAAILSCLH